MIETVTGKCERKNFGKTLSHEHISCASNNLIKSFGKKWLDRDFLAEYAEGVLCEARKKYDLGLFVDGTPIDLGRDITLLKKVSSGSGVKIVASTGFYNLPSFELTPLNENEIADLLISECVEGIENTDIKPGILKCAAGKSDLTDDIVKKHAAAAITQRKTGLPIYVHCEHSGDIAFEQIQVLKKHGAQVEKIIIGHAAIRKDVNYLEEILKTGCSISMDRCFCYPNETDIIAECISTLCRKGYANKILLSNDYCIHSDFAPRKLNGFHLGVIQQTEKLCSVFDALYDEYCKFGGSESDWEKITSDNLTEMLDI